MKAWIAMFGWIGLFEIRTAITHRLPLRLAMQTAVAGGLTFGVGQALGLQQLSWAVISALFVVQATIGGTLGTAAGRVFGAVLGAVIGLGWIFSGSAESMLLTGAGIAIGGAVTAYIAGLRPTLRYGSVTAAIIILNPGSDPLMQAWHYAAGIGLGAAVGALTSAFVFPWKSTVGISLQLGDAVRRCGDLLQACLSVVAGRESDRPEQIHEDIRR